MLDLCEEPWVCVPALPHLSKPCRLPTLDCLTCKGPFRIPTKLTVLLGGANETTEGKNLCIFLWWGWNTFPTTSSWIPCRGRMVFSSVQSLSCVWLFATLWIAAHQASLSITNSWSSPKLTVFRRGKNISWKEFRYLRELISAVSKISEDGELRSEGRGERSQKRKWPLALHGGEAEKP